MFSNFTAANLKSDIKGFLPSGRASVEINGQRVALSAAGIEKFRSDRSRRTKYGGGRADEMGQFGTNQRSAREDGTASHAE